MIPTPSTFTVTKQSPRLDWQVAPGTSVIIVNYNGGETLLNCLASLVQTIGPECEIIVVDNASTDNSAEWVGLEFPQIVLIRSQTNLGFGGGNNLGAYYAQGDYLIFLNPDTCVESGWLEALLEPFATNPHIGLVTSKIVLAERPDQINTCGNAIHLTGITLCRGMGAPRKAFDRAEAVSAVSGAAFAMRRSLFETLDGFDEEFFLYMEDTDLSWRAQLAGWQVWYTPQSIVRHCYRLRITARKVFYQERNRYLMLLKSMRWSTLVIMLPALLLAEILTWGFVLLADRANIRNKIEAYCWIVANWRSILHKREISQRLRALSDRSLLQRTGFAIDFGQAATGMTALAAKLVFNPAFALLRGLTLSLVR